MPTTKQRPRAHNVRTKRAKSQLDRVSDLARKTGRPLQEFQAHIVRAMAMPERETVAIVGKGNGKTSLGALIVLDHVLNHPDPLVLLCAASREQARVVWEECRRLAEHPATGGRLAVRHLELRRDGATVLQVVSSDGKRSHGPSPTLAICDEYWGHRNDAAYKSLASALPKRRDARLLVISTAAATAESPLGVLRARALAGTVEREGALTTAVAPGIRLLEWSAGPDDDVDDPAIVRACNPAAWLDLDDLMQQRHRLTDAEFRQFVCSQFGVGAGSWLPANAWTDCRGEVHFERGERIWVGLDMGGNRSDSALVWINAAGHVGSVIASGERADIDIADAVDTLASTYRIAELVFDPWHAGALARTWADRGLAVVTFPQTWSRLAPASQKLRDAIVARELTHDGDPQLAAHVAAAVMEARGRGWRISKPRPDALIDGLIALVMAWDRRDAKPAPSFRWHGFIDA